MSWREGWKQRRDRQLLASRAYGDRRAMNDPDQSGFNRAMYRLVRLFFQKPEQGAATSIYLASSPEVEGVTGKYFIKQRPVASSPESYDTATARRLWEVSSHLVGLASQGAQ